MSIQKIGKHYLNNFFIIISEQYESSDDDSKLQCERLLRRKNFLNRALNMEVEALKKNQMLVWRFSGIPLDKELKETESKSFGLSLFRWLHI